MMAPDGSSHDDPVNCVAVAAIMTEAQTGSELDYTCGIITQNPLIIKPHQSQTDSQLGLIQLYLNSTCYNLRRLYRSLELTPPNTQWQEKQEETSKDTDLSLSRYVGSEVSGQVQSVPDGRALTVKMEVKQRSVDAK